MDYGKLQFKLAEILAERGISKTRICKDLNISPRTFDRCCGGEFRLLDAHVLCKLCTYLHVAVNDLVVYIPPQER